MKVPTSSASMFGVALWDAHASMYERVFERSSVLYGQDALVLGQLPSTAGTAPRFLEVACATGEFALTAAARGFHVTASDFSPGMIARLNAKIASGAYDHLKISTRVVDGQTMDGFEDANFDVVGSLFGVFMFPDRPTTWRSVWRVLKPGGRLVFTSWDANTSIVRMSAYVLDHAANKPDILTPDHPMAGGPSPRFATETFREELQDAGFQNVHIHSVGHPMCFHSGQEFVEGTLDNVVFKSMGGYKQPASLQRCVLDYAQLVLDGVDPFGDEARASAAANAQKTAQSHPLWNQPFAMPTFGHVVVATKPLQK